MSNLMKPVNRFARFYRITSKTVLAPNVWRSFATNFVLFAYQEMEKMIPSSPLRN